MSEKLDLKELERKAFRSMYQDGLWDIYYGLIIICMSIFIYRPVNGYGVMNIILALCAFGAAYALFWAAKKYITVPRMGQVRFGIQREKRKRTLVMVLTGVVLLQVTFLIIELLAWADPAIGEKIKAILPDKTTSDLIVASIGALFVGPSMCVVAYFKDFQRGYYIAILMAFVVFLMIFFNQPIFPIIIGCLISLPGFVLFVRFLRKYPIRREDINHG